MTKKKEGVRAQEYTDGGKREGEHNYDNQSQAMHMT